MLYGQELDEAITAMGLNKRSFAAKCKRADGTSLSAQAIADLIHKRKVEPKEETIQLVEAALRRKCHCCGQYTDNPAAWPKAKR